MVLAAAIVLGKAASINSSRTIWQTVRLTSGIVMCGIALLFSFAGTRGLLLAVPLAAVGLALVLNRAGGVATLSGPWRNNGAGGRRSTVRTVWLEMVLDHETGVMAGQVLSGQFAGRSLQSLTEAEGAALLHDASGDSQSLQLIEAFMDRRFAGWRERHAWDGPSSHGNASGPMTREQAFDILGLTEGAGEADIRAAHRDLMKKFHPDQGGSTYLATKINAAKDLLLGS